MSQVKQLLSFLFSFFTFVLVFFSLIKLMFFLSTPIEIKLAQTWFYNLLDNETLIKEVSHAIVIDVILIIFFILPHSLLKTNYVKSFWSQKGLTTWERTIYNIITASTILLLIKYWMPVPGLTLWRIDVTNRSILWWSFVLLHIFAWSIIYGGSLMMDLPELLGWKQVYNDFHPGSPTSYKTAELRRYLGHIRHPSFLCFIIILWGVNVLSLDRFLLGLFWSVYMYIAWNPDVRDVAYQKSQLERKKFELTNQFIN